MFGTATFRIDLTDGKEKLEEFISRPDIVILEMYNTSEYLHDIVYVTYKREIN